MIANGPFISLKTFDMADLFNHSVKTFNLPMVTMHLLEFLARELL